MTMRILAALWVERSAWDLVSARLETVIAARESPEEVRENRRSVLPRREELGHGEAGAGGATALPSPR